jgi:hypothetical protein
MAAQIIESSGKLTFLRVHDVGTGYGPPNDFIDVEVVCQIDSEPALAFGFQLRNDNNGPARAGMLDLLRDAYRNNSTVTLDYYLNPGKNNCILFRTALGQS